MPNKKGGGNLPKTERRNLTQKERRARNVKGWQNLNIDNTIISQFDLRNKNPHKASADFIKELRKLSGVARSKRTKKINAERRLKLLLQYGYKRKDIRPIWLTSDKYIRELIDNPNIVYHSKYSLAVAFATLHDSNVYNTSYYEDDEYEDIKDAIKDRVKDAAASPDGSGLLAAAFKIFHGTEEQCETMLEIWGKHGYDLQNGKFDKNRYFKAVNRHDWTKREIAELTLCIIDQCNNNMVRPHIDSIRQFITESGLPFDDIFK